MGNDNKTCKLICSHPYKRNTNIEFDLSGFIKEIKESKNDKFLT